MMFRILLTTVVSAVVCEIGSAAPGEKSQTLSRFAIGPVPDGLGVNIHFTGAPAKDLDMIQAAGFRFIRMDFLWKLVEKEKGVYLFRQYDELTEGLAQRGIRALYILNQGNDLYEKDIRSVRTEAGRQAFARFAATAASRYRGKGVVWELWNEPNTVCWSPQPSLDDYMALAKVVFPAIRKADPEAILVAPGINRVNDEVKRPHLEPLLPIDFLDGCSKQGLLGMINGVSIHPYSASGPEAIVGDFRRLHELVKCYRPQEPDMPILSSEWGYSCLPPSGYATIWPPERQGAYLSRMFLVNLSLGMPISIWYDWHDDGQNPQNMEHNFGVVSFDYQPKPAYLAMQRLVRALNGLRFVRRLESPPEEWRLLFSDGARSTIAAWTTAQPRSVELIPGQKTEITEDPTYIPLP